MQEAKKLTKRIKEIEEALPEPARELDNDEKFEFRQLIAVSEEDPHEGLAALRKMLTEVEEEFKGQRKIKFWEKYYVVTACEHKILH